MLQNIKNIEYFQLSYLISWLIRSISWPIRVSA